MTVSTSQGHGSLTGFGDQCDLLDRFVELVIADNSKKQQQMVATLSQMWISLLQKFFSFVKEVSINCILSLIAKLLHFCHFVCE